MNKLVAVRKEDFENNPIGNYYLLDWEDVPLDLVPSIINSQDINLLKIIAFNIDKEELFLKSAIIVKEVNRFPSGVNKSKINSEYILGV